MLHTATLQISNIKPLRQIIDEVGIYKNIEVGETQYLQII